MHEQASWQNQTNKDSYVRLSSTGVWYSLRIITFLMPEISTDRWNGLVHEECQRRISMGNLPVGLRMGKSCGGLEVQPLQPRRMNSNVSDSESSQTPGTCASSSSASSMSNVEETQLQLTVIDSQSQSTEIRLPTQRRGIRWGKVTEEDLNSCHKAVLIKRIFSLQGKCDEYQKQLKKMKRAHKYQLVKSNKRNDVEMCKLDDDDDRALQISTGKVRLTKTGFVALGIRKALALSSAVAFPLAILFDVSRQTVCRAETSVWAMLVMRSAAFHKIISDVLNRISVFLANKDQATVSPSLALTDVDYAVVAAHDLGVPVPHSTDEIALADAPFFLGGTAFSGDATNSGVWRRNKLQGLILTSSFLVSPDQLSKYDLWHHAFASHTTVCFGCTCSFVGLGWGNLGS